MFSTKLVTRQQYLLSEGATFALVVGLALRGTWNYFTTRHVGLFDSQLVSAALLFAALYLTGSLVPRRYEQLPLWLFGGLAWLVALTSLLWWPIWWQVLALREYRAGWQLFAAAAVVVFSLVVRLSQRQRALTTVGRHGHRWIADWAIERPVLVRIAARRVLHVLGYREGE